MTNKLAVLRGFLLLLVGVGTLAGILWYVNNNVYQFYATNPTAKVTITPSKTKVLPSEDFTVNIALAGQMVNAVEMTVQYDSTRLQYADEGNTTALGYTQLPAGYFSNPVRETVTKVTTSTSKIDMTLVSLTGNQISSQISLKFKAKTGVSGNAVVTLQTIKLAGASAGTPTYFDISMTSNTATVTIEAPQATCTDTDGGLNYATKGTVTGTGSGCGTTPSTDLCANTSVLNERHCGSEKQCFTSAYTCPGGCSNGVCLPTPTPTVTSTPTPTIFCTDSDGGLTYGTKGTVTGNGSGCGTTPSTDLCANSSVINEMHCGPLKQCFTSAYTCPGGCTNGVCNPVCVPTISAPANNSNVPSNPTFTWSACSGTGVKYKLEVKEGSTIVDSVITTATSYTFAAPKWVNGVKYTWTVKTCLNADCVGGTPTGAATFTYLPVTPTPTKTPTPTVSPVPTRVPCSRHPEGDATCNDVLNVVDFGCWSFEYINKKIAEPILDKDGILPVDYCQKTADFDGKNSVDLLDFAVWQVNFIKEKTAK